MGNRNSRPITIPCPTAAAFLSPLGAREIFDAISANFGRLSPGGSLIVDLSNNQEQVIANPVPEPSAALVFGLGKGLVGSLTWARLKAEPAASRLA